MGIFVATVLNHAGAGAIGALLSNLLSPNILNWIIVASFALMAVWILIPDKFDDNDLTVSKKHLGVFATTLFAFFLAEMGDKTQIATVALAARYQDFFSVVLGTMLGMMLANVPAVYLGHRFADKLPTKAIHAIASVIFVVLGGLTLHRALTGAGVWLN